MPLIRTVGSCSSRVAIARAISSTRSRSAAERLSQRDSFSARTWATIASARSRSAATVGITSWEPSQRSKRESSESRMPLARRRLGLAAGGVALDDRLDVVDVVEADALELAAVGVDVARHREVDQQQRLLSPLPMITSSSRALDQVVGRVGGGDDDVGALELGRQLVDPDRAAAEALRPGRSRGCSGGWRRRRPRRRGRPARARSARRSRRRRPAARGASARSPRLRWASSTATEGIETPFSPTAVSVRARLPAASAPRKRRLRIGPVAPSTRASS